MPVLPQTLFAFVGCHLVSFPLFSARHLSVLLYFSSTKVSVWQLTLNITFYLVHK
jgi:hypothetical protein